MKQLLATAVVVAALTGAASACPMCKDSLPNQEGTNGSLHDSYDTGGGMNISGGINTSVYVMLATLFGAIGLVSTVLVKGARSSAPRHGVPVVRPENRDESNHNKSL
jgi:hypothetical protein